MKNKINFQIRLSQLATLFFAWAACVCIMPAPATAQNVFSGEPVQWVGRPNGYSTTPYNSDYRTTVYRKVSTTVANPADGRGQWATTINVQNSGGNITPDNMPGGGGAGWLLISGPSGNRFQNKWNFTGVGQGALNAINDVTLNAATDMGLNMSGVGYYTFVMRDAGYVNSQFYVGVTANAPVSVSRTSQTFLAGAAIISITTGGTPSAGENVYVRYRSTTNNFTASTSVVQATGSGTAWSATIPTQPCGTVVHYYVYSSTRTLAQINADSDINRSLATLRYDDNTGTNYTYTHTAVTASCSGTNSTCGAIADGTAMVTAGAGSGSYSYSWAPGAQITQQITAQTLGTYSVTVTDVNGCQATCSFTVSQPLIPNFP
ncbi:MAG: hypothetical protein IPP29_14905 [Bacteroidetes bacterium]|nr:hypothetical protein [Bacteroidota bacterium]